ncbi:unnamed protein product [Sphagnum balticum]
MVGGGAVAELSSVLPRVLIVSSRTVRKNKFVNFVGEYHLDLIVSYGAVPVIVPRVSGVHSLLDSFEPIHGVLLCEGEDVDPTLYESDISSLTEQDLEEIKAAHSSNTSIDKDKDSIELQLARRCLERNIPYLGICRGSQVLNVACGGSLYQDVERELSRKVGVEVQHINYGNYDGHRHSVSIVEGSPLHDWFNQSLEPNMELFVNSYHHQGVKRLAARFKPMAYAADSLVEGFYDPDVYNPDEGKFIVGLQFHPERMRHQQDLAASNSASDTVFDYPGCPRAYQEFVKAVVAYQKKLLGSGKEIQAKQKEEFTPWMEKQRQQLMHSFSKAKLLYEEQRKAGSVHNSNSAIQALQEASENQRELEVGAEFLQSTMPLNKHQVKRLNQMGATVRNSSIFLEKLETNKHKQSFARTMLEGMHMHEVQETLDFYKMMVDVASSVLEQKRQV